MNKEILKEVIKDLDSLSTHLKTLLVEPKVEAEKSKAVKEKPEPKVSLEDVRARLAVLSQHGKTAEVKALIVKFGANRLSEVDESKYAELLQEAEDIKSD